MRPRREKTLTVLALVLICVAALALRLYGIDWDQGYLFHPDERQVLYVTDDLLLPRPFSLAALLDPEGAWNPHFFSYGTLPMYLLRLVTDVVGRVASVYAEQYGNYILGRLLSTLFDVGTVLLVFVIARRLYDRRTGLIASALAALAVLHIQLSHFYTVDTLLTFFLMATLAGSIRLARRGRMAMAVPLGLALGAALATKVSAGPMAVIVVLAWGLATTRAENPLAPNKAVAGCVLTALISLGVFFVCEPFALLDWESFISDVASESMMVRGGIDWPYTRQYDGTLPYIYLFWQTVKWSLGFPLGLAGFAGAVWATVQQVRIMLARRWQALGAELLPVVWFVLYFGLVGQFHTKFLRYMLPVIPLLCIWAAHALLTLVRRRDAARVHWERALLPLVLGGTALYAAAFMNIYRDEHPWIRATRYMCANCTQNASIMVEDWDDPLPIWQGTDDLRCMINYHFLFFYAHNADTQDKLDSLVALLSASDYVSISSNRLYNALPRLPERFPLTARYYELLMSGELGFELINYEETQPSLWGVTLADDTFHNPDLPVPALIASAEHDGLYLNLGRADESFTVYDHPKPLLFAKTRELTADEIRALFDDVAATLPPGEE